MSFNLQNDVILEDQELTTSMTEVTLNETPFEIPLAAPGMRSRTSSIGSINDAVKAVEDKIFDMFADSTGQKINLAKFLKSLDAVGLKAVDPRLTQMYAEIDDYQQQMLEADSDHRVSDIDRNVFHTIIKDNIELINRALSKSLVIPEFAEFCKDIAEIYAICKDNNSGANAAYIPQLERYDPNYWGVSVCTVDGQRFDLGDVNIPFTIQSTSKAVNYALALSEYGEQYVHKYVGREPSGRFFNEICLDTEGRPHNPMINAGAIMTVGLYKPELAIGDRFDRYLETFKAATGGEHLSFNASVFLSERESADRNNALSYFMRENNCYPAEGKDKFQKSLELYFQLCSLETTSKSSAVIAGTLANGGVCPTTGERVFKADMVKHVLSLMLSCGMYDYSGHFAFSVGLPAKSGVGGSLLIVIPGVMGICCWSPPLDAHGNSARGVQFSQELVAKFAFHNFDSISMNKKDPRKSTEENKSLAVVNLLFAAQAGDISALRRYHLADVDMNLADYDGRTALHLAACENHKECVAYLLKHCGCDSTLKDRWDNSALEDAAKGGFTDVVKLIERNRKTKAKEAADALSK